MAESTTRVPYEALIGQFQSAVFASEAFGVPVGIHCFDHPPDDELAAFVAARRKEYLEISFAVFAAFEFVKDTISELLEALRTSENYKSNTLKQRKLNKL